MGIYDREYYRREGPSFLDSVSNRGRVCLWLVGINVAVFIIQMMTRQQLLPPELEGVDLRDLRVHFGWGPGAFTNALILDPQAVLHGQIWRLLTYAFLHDTSTSDAHRLQHALPVVVRHRRGGPVRPREFLAFYLVSAVAGGLCLRAGGHGAE